MGWIIAGIIVALIAIVFVALMAYAGHQMELMTKNYDNKNVQAVRKEGCKD